MQREPLKYHSHSFGDLIRRHLSRKHGLSQNKLAEGIDQDPAVIADMCHGKRLNGPQARERVISMIDWFHIQEVLTLVAEANVLLEAAGMSSLNLDQPSERALLGKLGGLDAGPLLTGNNISLIHHYEANLIAATSADAAAKKLGDLVLEYHDKEAMLAIWRAICETDNLPAIIDPCAATIGRIVQRTLSPDLEDMGFDIFTHSVGTNSELIIDKFAYVVGQVALQANTNKTRQRAWQFVINQAVSTNPIVRDKYTYTKNRIIEQSTGI